jgi:hypothetical protein
MPFDVGTIASVIVGGAITGGATIFTATRAQEARERREAEREEARTLASARTAARVCALDLLIVVGAITATISNGMWWPIELPSMPTLDDRKLLAGHMRGDDWLDLAVALASIPPMRTMREIAIAAGRTHVTEDEAASLDAWLAAVRSASQVLERFGVEK